jgi:hypothetical protein
MDEEDINDELELPSELSGLSIRERRNLLRFKRSHNEVSSHLLYSLY